MQGLLFIVSAPSGAGKTSLLKALLATDSQLELSVSHTTRAVRPGEQEAVHYHFVSLDEFMALSGEAVFLEQAQVFGNHYATSEVAVRAQLDQGKDLVLEIDWQGAQQVRKRFPEAVSIFIAPPSIDALAERLGARGQDDEIIIERRMADARNELSHYPEYDYLVINDDFEHALSELNAIVVSERLRMLRSAHRHVAALSQMLSEAEGEVS